MKNINHRDIFGGLFREGFETQHWPDGNQGDILVSTGEQWIPSNLNGAGIAPNTASFVTVNNEASLTSERRLDADYGFSIVDNGAGSNVVVTPPVPGPAQNVMTSDGTNWYSDSVFNINTMADSMGVTKYDSADYMFSSGQWGLPDGYNYIGWPVTQTMSNVPGVYPKVDTGFNPQHLYAEFAAHGRSDGCLFRFDETDSAEQWWLVNIVVTTALEYLDEGIIKLKAELAFDTDWNTGSKFIESIPLSVALPLPSYEDDQSNHHVVTANYSFVFKINPNLQSDWSLSFQFTLADEFSLGDGDGIPAGNFYFLSQQLVFGDLTDNLNDRRAETSITFLQLKQQVNSSALNTASYVTLGTHPNLTNERVLQGSLGFTFADGGANNNITLTPPTPGTSGNFLRSNGTNWVSQTVNNGVASGLLPNCTSGQHLVASGTNTWAATTLPVNGLPGGFLPSAGSNAQVLTSNGTAWAAATIPTGGGSGSLLPAPGTSGNFLRSNGTVWQSETVTQGVVGGLLPSAGSNLQVLTSNGTSWAAASIPTTTFRAFSACKAAVQTLPGGPTAISFPTVSYNINSCVNVLTTSTFEIINTGFYVITVNTQLSSTTAVNPPQANARILLNPATTFINLKWCQIDATTDGTNATLVCVNLHWEGNLTAGDIITIMGTGNGWIWGAGGTLEPISSNLYIRQLN